MSIAWKRRSVEEIKEMLPEAKVALRLGDRVAAPSRSMGLSTHMSFR